MVVTYSIQVYRQLILKKREFCNCYPASFSSIIYFCIHKEAIQLSTHNTLCFFFCLTLNGPIATQVVCFSRLLKCLRSLYGKQRGPRSDCSYRSSLFWVHAVCLYTLFISNVMQLVAADGFSRRHFQMHFFLGALRVKQCLSIPGKTTCAVSLRYHGMANHIPP